MAKLIGTDPNQVPTNADLGTMAYLDYNTLKPQLLAGGNRNLIINGAMRVAQRGTSSTSNGFQTVDRFKNGTQTIGITQSQESITSGAPFEEGFLNYYRQTVTTPSSASNVIAEIKHSIEAQDIAGSGWNFKSASKSLTLSFYVRSSVSGTYYSYIRSTDASPEQFYRFSFVLSANIWTKVEKTIAGNSNLVFPNDNGEGLAIFWVPAFGTSYTGSSVNLDQWETLSGTDYIPDVTHAWGNTSGATFDLTGVQLEVGDTATPFEHRSYGDELSRCLRYYWRNGASVENKLYYRYGGHGESISSVQAQVNQFFPVPMRAHPTLTASGVISWYSNGAIVNPSGAFSVDGNSGGKYMTTVVNATLTGLTTGRAGSFLSNNNTTSFMEWDAEL